MPICTTPVARHHLFLPANGGSPALEIAWEVAAGGAFAVLPEERCDNRCQIFFLEAENDPHREAIAQFIDCFNSEEALHDHHDPGLILDCLHTPLVSRFGASGTQLRVLAVWIDPVAKVVVVVGDRTRLPLWYRSLAVPGAWRLVAGTHAAPLGELDADALDWCYLRWRLEEVPELLVGLGHPALAVENSDTGSLATRVRTTLTALPAAASAAQTQTVVGGLLRSSGSTTGPFGVFVCRRL